MIIFLDGEHTRKVINLQHVTRTYIDNHYGQMRLVILFVNGDSEMLGGSDIDLFFELVNQVRQ